MVLPTLLRPTISGVISDLGTGGVVTVTPKLFKANWQNVRGEDISWGVISARVTCDPERDQTWILDATITLECWLTLKPYLDWVRPELTVRMPDGTTRWGQLGLYLVLDSAEHREEMTGTVKLDARSPTWLFGAQGFTTKFRCGAGQNRMARVRALFDEAVLTGGDDADRSMKRYFIPNHGKEFTRAKEWPKATARNDVANEILTGTGFYPVWDNEVGEFHTRRRGVQRLLDREPVRVWTAHVPASGSIDARIRAAAAFPSEVIGAIDTTPDSADQISEIIVVNDDPYSVRQWRKRKRAKNQKNKRGKTSGRQGTGRGGAKGRKYHHPLIDDDATAQEVADGLLDELSTHNSTMTITVLPDPTFVAIRETIMLGLWDQFGRVIANDKYLVHSVEYGLNPTDPLMRIHVGRVEDIDEE